MTLYAASGVIDSNLDNCGWYGAAQEFNNDSLIIGYHGKGHSAAFRFNHLEIPPRARIREAYLKFHSASTKLYNTVRMHLSIENTVNASGVTSADIMQRFSNRTGDISWSPLPWYVNKEYQTTDISPLVQTIINKVAWASGYSMLFFVSDAFSTSTREAHRAIRPFSYASGTSAVELHIAYDPPKGDMEIHEFYNPYSKDLFLTEFLAEGQLVPQYTHTGICFNIKDGEEDPAAGVYRLYNSSLGRHLYTVGTAEKNALVAAGWVLEGNPAFLVTSLAMNASGVPMYRMYNTKNGEHRYEWQPDIISTLVATNLWTNEGICWYVSNGFESPVPENIESATPINGAQATVTIITYGHSFGSGPAGMKYNADVRNVDAPGTYKQSETGYMDSIRARVMSTSTAKRWLRTMIEQWMPNLVDGDKVSIGCSRGHHRSVSLMIEFKAVLEQNGFTVLVIDRDIKKKW